MEERRKRKIIPQMFDVRPVDAEGNLDLEKINRIKSVIALKRGSGPVCRKEAPAKPKIYQLGSVFNSEEVPFKYDFDKEGFQREMDFSSYNQGLLPGYEPEKKKVREKKIPKKKKFFKRKMPVFRFPVFEERRLALEFATVCLVITGLLFGSIFLGKGLGIKDRALLGGETALAGLNKAKDSILRNDFVASLYDFENSRNAFGKMNSDLGELGFILVESGKILPLTSKLTSGKYLALSGEKISEIGMEVSVLMQSLEAIKNPVGEEQISFLEVFKKTDRSLQKISGLLEALEGDLENVDVDDLPEDKREKFVLLKNELPEARKMMAGFLNDSQILYDILGGNGPRKYLFLFQNNNEMRPTGGFIGTYALLDIFDGRIKRLKVDGIFNPDGQLREKVVPPAPIQKISAAWSLHDSNWWPDFPTSAEKASWFWEKTGGPTVDGVIAMTPEVIRKLLEITGPIELPEYGKWISQENFMEEVQQEVEVDYDKDLNQPKKILADLAPKVLDKIFTLKNPKDFLKTLKVLNESLDEKHILIYSSNYSIQEVISQKGWSGEVLQASKDYLSVINSNINGYKTDGVVKETIQHYSQIQDDGRIINEVSITRRHEGGNSDYEWFNKVNANYQRLYVPEGSRLISVSGQTREFNDPPLDYKALKFKVDPQVAMEEQDMRIDDESGTRIYSEKGKTVFANWVYVSPQEEVKIVYRYELPFRINPGSKAGGVDNYSLLAQKQSGSRGSRFESKIAFSERLKVIWKYPESDFRKTEGNELNFSGDLSKDKFLGITFSQ